MRMVRAWSAIAWVMAGRIHQVGVGGELVALGVVEFLHAADQAQVAFLDQVQEQRCLAAETLAARAATDQSWEATRAGRPHSVM